MTIDADHALQRVVLCGASGTLGRAIAAKMSAEGNQLALLGRDRRALSSLIEQLPTTADMAPHRSIECDLSRPESVDAAIQTAEHELDGIDVFISAAGAAQGGIFWELDDAAWQRNLDIKLFGNLRAIRAVIPKMIRAKRGRIVLIAGNSAEKPDPRMLPGAAANAALLAIVKGLADELTPHGISINAVNPGPVRSARFESLMSAEAARSQITAKEAEMRFLARSGLRALVTAEDVATRVAHLASPMSTSPSGSSITIENVAITPP